MDQKTFHLTFLCGFCLYLYFCIHLSRGSDDMLQVQHTVHQDENKRTQFQQTTLFIGHVIFSCKKPSKTESCQARDQPRQSWLAKAFTQKEVQDRDHQCEQECSYHLHWLRKVEETTAATGGVLQRLRGCKINSSGEFPFDKWGVDGEDFLNFDPETLTWTSLSYKANHLATEWNSRDGLNDAYRKFCQTLCNTIHILKQVETTTSDTETGAQLHIFSRPISGGTVTSLWCFVTYSDLSGLSVLLTEDGIPLNHGVNVTGPLPNGDGTVQMRLSVEVTLGSSRTYKCEVYSETVNKSVDFGNLLPQQSTVIVTVTCVVVAVCVTLLIGGCCWWRHRQDRCLPPVPSNGINPPVAQVPPNGNSAVALLPVGSDLAVEPVPSNGSCSPSPGGNTTLLQQSGESMG